jgi:hypothetical protein
MESSTLLPSKELAGVLMEYNKDYPSSPSDMICGVVPTKHLDDAGTNGMAHRNPNVIILSTGGSPLRTIATLAHEMGHIFGLGEEYLVSQAVREDDTTSLLRTDEGLEFDKNPPPRAKDPLGRWEYAGTRYAEDPTRGWFMWWKKDVHDDWLGRPQHERYCIGTYVGEGAYDVIRNSSMSGGTEVCRIFESQYATFSLMSSGDACAMWVSEDEYRALINYFRSDSTAKAGATSLGDIFLLSSPPTKVMVSGTLNGVDKTGRLDPVVPAGNLEVTREAEDPKYQLVFRSREGTIVDTINFQTGWCEYYDPCDLHFSLVVDIPGDPSIIQLVVEGQVVDELVRSEASPAVQVKSPGAGEIVTDETLVTWAGSDPDSDELTYTVEYSHDNGQNWGMISIDQTATELLLDAPLLPGGDNCLVKVIASDGWNQGEDISGPFSVPTKPPTVSIVYPPDGAVLLRSAGLQGQCVARDPETGEIADPKAIVWSSDGDGVLGSGSVLGFNLSLGPHVLTVTATDPEGKTATDQVNITVSAHACDLNFDERIDFLDMMRLSQNWLANCSAGDLCQGTDLNHDGKIDLRDLSVFAAEWREKRLEPPGPLVAHWTFDEAKGTKAQDSERFSISGEVHGARWTPGKISGALSFDGLDDYVDCGNSDILAPDLFTIAFWMFVEGRASYQYILGKANDMGLEQDYAFSTGGDGKLEFAFGEQTKTVGVQSKGALLVGQWVFVAATRDGATASLYLNGQPENSVPYSFAATDKGQSLRIGSIGMPDPGWAGFFKGKLDDVRIYDKALSAAEIQELYKQVSP